MLTTLKHDNGLTLVVPDGGFDIRETPAGRRLSSPGSRKVRTPSELQIELREGSRPDGAFPKTRRLGTSTFRYEVASEGGGSGGDEHLLRAWTEAGEKRHLWIQQRIQAEPPQPPDFEATWKLLEGLGRS